MFLIHYRYPLIYSFPSHLNITVNQLKFSQCPTDTKVSHLSACLWIPVLCYFIKFTNYLLITIEQLNINCHFLLLLLYSF
jgi:hypothetical protein